MNKVRATYKRLDNNNGDFLAHYQWRVMQDSVMFVWKGLQDDEDGMVLLFNSNEFDSDDLKLYNDVIKDLWRLPYFRYVYSVISNSTTCYIEVIDFKVTERNYEEEKDHYNWGGYFAEANDKTVSDKKTIKAGSEENPHQINLYSSKKPINSKTKKPISVNWIANGFDVSAIFEEFFHAAHFIFLNEKKKYDKNTFYSQTETEVALMKSLINYMICIDKSYNSLDCDDFKGFDAYKFVNFSSELTNSLVVSMFDDMTKDIFNKVNMKDFLSENPFYEGEIRALIDKKNGNAYDIAFDKIDKEMPFLMFLINQYKEERQFYLKELNKLKF